MNQKEFMARKRASMTIRTDRDYGLVASGFIHWEKHNLYHSMISGGSQGDRTRAVLSLIRMARRAENGGQPLPVIILEQGNEILERFFCTDGSNAVIRRKAYRVDPLCGRTDLEIAKRLYDVACLLDKNCGSGLRSLLRIGCELLRLQNERPGIAALSRLPWTRLRGYIDRMVERDELEAEAALEIQGELSGISVDPGAAAELLEELNREYGIMAPGGAPEVGFEDVLDNDGIACIRLRTGMRAMRELMAVSLREASLCARQFVLIADSVTLPDGESRMKELLYTRSTEFSVIMSYDDLPAKLDSDFLSLVTGDTNVIAFSHQSGPSAEAWADFIGKSYQMKTGSSSAVSRSLMRPLDRQITRGQTREEELRHVVAGDQIQHLKAGEALIQAGKPGSALWISDYRRLFELQKNHQLLLQERND